MGDDASNIEHWKIEISAEHIDWLTVLQRCIDSSFSDKDISLALELAYKKGFHAGQKNRI